jgi:hypothetical protein
MGRTVVDLGMVLPLHSVEEASRPEKLGLNRSLNDAISAWTAWGFFGLFDPSHQYQCSAG